MLKCSTSLWSADLVNLASDIRRVEPYSERFHIDVVDGHYRPTLLFFPDLVSAIRKQTKRPLEIHLMVTEPMKWVDPFIEAGTDGIIFSFDSLKDPAAALRAVKAKGKFVGVALTLDESLDVLDPFWPQLDLLVLLGTVVGVKGASMDPSVPDRIRIAKRIARQRSLKFDVECDGGIRRESVPLMAAAGANFIVPGSLMFKEDPAQMRAWLATLGPAPSADQPSSSTGEKP